MKKSVFITGCSTGIGFSTAQRLLDRGYRVIASCRAEKDVERLNQLGIETLRMDVNDSASIKSACQLLEQRLSGRLDVLINNAGYGQAGALEDVPRDVMRRQFETNVFGLLEVTQRVIPWMRKQGFGRIINISSVLGEVSLPFRGAYNASKHAVEAISDTLELELQNSGIKVVAIQPGPIKSAFRDTVVDRSLRSIDIERSHFKKQYHFMLERFKEKKTSSSFTRTPEAVIVKIIHAIESTRPRLKYPVTLAAHLLILARRLLSYRMLSTVLARISRSELR